MIKKLLPYIFFVAAVSLFLASFWILQTSINKLTVRLEVLEKKKPLTPIVADIFESNDMAASVQSDNLKELTALRTYIDVAIASISAQQAKTSTASVSSVPSVKKTQQTNYIPFGTSFVTQATDWVDVPDSDEYIDVENDYAKDAYITWSASLKVAHGNGKAFVRLYDATNNIAVVGSELSTVDNAVFQKVTSGQLALWRGKNLYKVQIKSLNSFEVTYSGGSMKVTY